MNTRPLFWILAFVLIVCIVGCQKQDAEPVAAAEVAEETAKERPSPGGIGATNELALGTLRLEGTADAITPEQAVNLLPLWQIIQAGSLKSQAETEAVLTQIKGKMSESQLSAIEAMSMTMEDMQAWMQEQGIEMPAPQGDGQGGRAGGPGALGDLSEEERAKMREQFQSMNAEERATRMAEMGIQRPEGGQGPGANPGMARGGRQSSPMLSPLIALLTARAAP
jgi:hypothetical protein